jgi:hypothetical protein
VNASGINSSKSAGLNLLHSAKFPHARWTPDYAKQTKTQAREGLLDNDLWREEFRKWLESYSWDWFCSLTFRPGLIIFQGPSRVRRWAQDLGTALGTKNFRWIAIPEMGATRMNFHYHCLVGGLRSSSAGARNEWECRWNKLAGDARIAQFNPQLGGIGYFLKNAEPDDMDEIEIHFNSQSKKQAKLGTK